MSVAPGTRLGAYEMVARVGAGGISLLGEGDKGPVNRTKGTRLKRDVALEIFADVLATKNAASSDAR